MILKRLHFRHKTPPQSSILDVPPSQYDKATCLPATIHIAGRRVTPLVGIQEVRDHLTLLAAFHELMVRSGDRLHRIMNSAAFDYERWASTVLPMRARRKHSGASDNSANTPPLSWTWSPPESPISDISSAASSTATEMLPLSAGELPPLPVLMCWHAHLLNPGQFSLDAEANYAWLQSVPFPLHLAAEAIRADALPQEIQHVFANNLRHVPSISGWTPPDISAAVQRQSRIINTLHDLGWLESSYIDGDIAPFQSSIVRYHAWLDLIWSVDSFLAPTFDIMLAWATHELHGTSYLRQTEKLLGIALDRPIDRAEQGDHDALKRASGLWKARFKHDYFGRKPPTRRSTV